MSLEYSAPVCCPYYFFAPLSQTSHADTQRRKQVPSPMKTLPCPHGGLPDSINNSASFRQFQPNPSPNLPCPAGCGIPCPAVLRKHSTHQMKRGRPKGLPQSRISGSVVACFKSAKCLKQYFSQNSCRATSNEQRAVRSIQIEIRYLFDETTRTFTTLQIRVQRARYSIA
jgi:hypothetical protein